MIKQTNISRMPQRICMAALFFNALCAVTLAQTTATDASTSYAPSAEKAPELKTLFGETFTGNWRFSGEGTISQEYDDNVFSAASSSQLSDNISRLSSRLSVAIRRKRLTFQVHYLPQYSIHSKYRGIDSLSQQVSQELTYAWSRKTDLQWSASASRLGGGSSSPFLLVQSQGTDT